MTATQMKTSLENISLCCLYYFVIITICSTCIMWLNYPVTEQMGTVFKLSQRMKNLPSRAHVLHKTLNLVISHCCLAETMAKKCTKIFKLSQRMKNLPSHAHVLHKTLNLVISHCCLAETMAKKCTKILCRAFVFLIKSDC